MAIDWSGNETAAAQRNHIWVADWHRGSVTLTGGRTGQQTAEHVIHAAMATPATVAGFDFAFSYPAWFFDSKGCASAPALWQQVRDDGKAWLKSCEPPFWGRPAKRCPLDHREPHRRGFRITEVEVKQRTGRWPSSSFQIGGAGAVGTGSIRGMPHLLTLREHGFCVWPFDPPGYPVALEIYPRIFTGRTRVSDRGARAEHLRCAAFTHLPAAVLAAAEHSPDAFDALCALMGMVEHREQLAVLPAKPERALEGEIWMPRQM